MSEFAPSAVSVASFSSLFLFFPHPVHFYPCCRITHQLESLGISKEAMQFQVFLLENK